MIAGAAFKRAVFGIEVNRGDWARGLLLVEQTVTFLEKRLLNPDRGSFVDNEFSRLRPMIFK